MVGYSAASVNHMVMKKKNVRMVYGVTASSVCMRERQRERERERERQTDRQRQTDSDRQREMENP
jgi:hypothetical protein